MQGAVHDIRNEVSLANPPSPKPSDIDPDWSSKKMKQVGLLRLISAV
jgi:hypothetical protein